MGGCWHCGGSHYAQDCPGGGHSAKSIKQLALLIAREPSIVEVSQRAPGSVSGRGAALSAEGNLKTSYFDVSSYASIQSVSNTHHRAH